MFQRKVNDAAEAHSLQHLKDECENGIALLERIERHGILDQDFFEIPRLEIEICGHLASILRWNDLAHLDTAESDSLATFFVDLDDPLAEIQYPARADRPLTTRHLFTQRYDRLMRRKRTFNDLCVLQSVVRSSVDLSLGYSPNAMCKYISKIIGMSLPFQLQAELECDGLDFEVNDSEGVPLHRMEVKWIRRAVVLLHVSALYSSYGKPWSVPLFEGRGPGRRTWLEPKFQEQQRVILQTLPEILERRLKNAKLM